MFRQKPALIIVRNYESRSQSDAGKAMAKDANKLAKQGYLPVSQSWQAKGHSIKSKVALGLFVLATRSGKGTLTVTYQLQSPAPVLAQPAAPVFTPVAVPVFTQPAASVFIPVPEPVFTPAPGPVFTPVAAPVDAQVATPDFAPAPAAVEPPVIAPIADRVVTPVQPISSPTGWTPAGPAKPVIVAGSPEDTWRQGSNVSIDPVRLRFRGGSHKWRDPWALD